MIDIKRFKKILPASESNLKRLKFLNEQASDIRVAVFGKFNHGKSTLLNAIIGSDVFQVSDKRETIEVQEHKHNDVIWIDTPGLDADIRGEDDRKAQEGAFERADFLLLVHSVKAGELDKYEVEIYHELMRQEKNYRKKMFLVLTQIDQLENEDFKRVLGKIKEQFPDLIVISVSATRHIRGIAEGKSIFVEKSGMTELFKLIAGLHKNIKPLRINEKERLVGAIKIELNEKRNELAVELDTLYHQMTGQQANFKRDLKNYINSVQSGL